MKRDDVPPICEVQKRLETLLLGQIEVSAYVDGLVKSIQLKAARLVVQFAGHDVRLNPLT